LLYAFLDVQPLAKGNRMGNVKYKSLLTRSIHLAVIALFAVSLTPRAWSDETGEPADTTTLDAGMGAGSLEEEAPPAAKPAHKRKAKHAKKKKMAKHKKKKHAKKSAKHKKKKKKKHSANY
jgi:hypothetical protein